MENTAQNTEDKTNVAIIGTGAEGKLAAIAPILYDADARQSLTFDVKDDEGKYEITQIYLGLPDEVLFEYDRLRSIFLEQNGGNTDLKTEAMDADNYFFDALCEDVLGFEEDKPQDWKDLIDYDEKKFGISKLLGFKILSDDSEKAVKKRSWSKTPSHTIQLKSRFNAEIVTTSATFAKKTPGDVARYAAMKSRISLQEKNLDDMAIKIPSSMRKKAELFDRMSPVTTGYAGRVPVHHKAAFITGLFEPNISNSEKK